MSAFTSHHLYANRPNINVHNMYVCPRKPISIYFSAYDF